MSSDELSFYRTVEDYFARLRGTTFLFTPKDFALLRQWWSEGVPVAAVMAGIGEVMARRQDRGEDPVSSLSYCRHAVARHAKRFAAAAVGGVNRGSDTDVPALLRTYVDSVREAADRWSGPAGTGEVLVALADAVASLPVDAPVAALDAAVTSLEASALEAAAAALPPAERATLEGAVSAAVVRAGDGAAVPPAAARALRLRTLRTALGLPRLELAADAG